MPDETTPPAGQEPQVGAGQAPTTTPTMTLEQALEALAATRREAASHRTKLTALEKAQQEAEAAKLSDLEKATKERDTLKAELDAERQDRRDRINRYEVQLAAGRLGIVDPEAAVKLLDWDSLEYSEDGSPKGVDAALRKLLAAKPYLAGQQQAGAPPANTTNPASGRGRAQLTVADVKAMSKDQINARWSEVQAALRRGV